MSEKTKQVSSLLLPMHEKPLVVPNVSVAEIIPFRSPESLQEAPGWHLGSIEWRNTKVSVISFDLANEKTEKDNVSAARIAIFNDVLKQEGMKFFAVVIQGIPRLLKVNDDEITEEEVDKGPLELMHVKVMGEHAIIPNVAKIQQLMLSCG